MSGPKPVRTSSSTGWPIASTHPAHLAVAPLVDRQLDQIRVASADAAHASGRGAAVLELDAVAQDIESVVGDGGSAQLRTVGLGHFETWMGEAVGERAVVGEQDQPGAIDVQSPHGI